MTLEFVFFALCVDRILELELVASLALCEGALHFAGALNRRASPKSLLICELWILT